MRDNVIRLALDEPALSPRELAVRFSDSQSFRLPPAEGARPDRQSGRHRDYGRWFKDKTTASNQLRQSDFTYLKVISWGWFLPVSRARRLLALHLSLPSSSRMRAEDVTATLDLALQASGLDQAKPTDRPWLLSDNGSSYVSARFCPGHRVIWRATKVFEFAVVEPFGQIAHDIEFATGSLKAIEQRGESTLN